MKTPRKLLFNRHRNIASRLDTIRKGVVEGLREGYSRDSKPSSAFLRLVWTELVWPLRRVWAGFAMVWVLIVFANTDFQSDPSVAMANRSKPAVDIVLALRQQEQMWVEFFSKPEPMATPPKQPEPRSQRRHEVEMDNA